MLRHTLVAALALTIFASIAGAQPPKIEKGVIKPTPTTDGATMFNTYCAVCHGKDGTGTGPAASSLTKVPADLTKISARNKGTFPEIKVKRYIEGLDEVPSHGTRDMPIWGDLFKSLDRDTALLRVAALSDYLKSIQK